MKGITKKILTIGLIGLLSLANVVTVNAADVNSPARSGGAIKTSFDVTKCTLISTTWNYTDLVSAWAKCSSYTVKKTVTKGTTTTVTASVAASAAEQLTAKMGITYGTSVSTATSIGRVLPANASRNSKLRYKVQMKKFNVTIRMSTLYYDTSAGYYTTSYDYSGTITVPNKNQTYIEVYYQ